MSEWDKLLSRIVSLDKDLRFEEFKKDLESFGYTMHFPQGGSSHCTFRKKGKQPITIPRHVIDEKTKKCMKNYLKVNENA